MQSGVEDCFNAQVDHKAGIGGVEEDVYDDDILSNLADLSEFGQVDHCVAGVHVEHFVQDLLPIEVGIDVVAPYGSVHAFRELTSDSRNTFVLDISPQLPV